jgi:enoyl-CoA hydratase
VRLTDSILFESLGSIAVITIDRPNARNAVNGDVATGLELAVDRLESDHGLWIGILASTSPVFCAGADLKLINEGRATEFETERGGFAGFVRRERQKPFIAAVEGPALAGGLEICLACDLIVASRSASFGIPEVKRNLIAAAGGLFRLGRQVPLSVAMECALTGDPLPADRALLHGLVNELCEPGQTLSRATQLAQRITANGPLAVRASRNIVLSAPYESDDVGWQMSAEASARMMASADVQEGLAAFIEKREPQWQGR